ncbi:MAG: hypothetical protein F6J90_11045 [Moorea sp. SIOASIH]|nr:hypothetical protein [Moorena sp. SIOASIH]
MGETTAVAHGGDHGSRSWGKPRQSLMGETPKTALPPLFPCCLPCSLAASPVPLLHRFYCLLVIGNWQLIIAVILPSLHYQ